MNENAALPYAVQEDGTFKVRAFDLPISQFFDLQTRNVYRRHVRRTAEIMRDVVGLWTDPQAITAVRKCFAAGFLPSVEEWRVRCPVRIEPATVANVDIEIYTPVDGVPAAQRERLLINLHGGGFMVSAEYAGRLESIPVAAWGKVKVVSVDYRMAPEHHFPAATDDVLTVYRHFLKDYSPQNIAVFGCSAGAVLTAQTVARLQKEGLPLPGAVGMFCGAGSFWNEGDSGHLGHAAVGIDLSSALANPYFENVDPQDPLVFPTRSSEALAKFPPSLLMTATRDFALSSVVHMHSRLVALGVEAQLNVWEGLDHGFFYNPDFPQTREAYEVMVRFFDRHLGKR